MTAADAIIVIGGGLVLGLVVPYVLMRLLVPALESAATAVNYRGNRVFAGLGVVWLVWAGAAIVGGVLGTGMQGDRSLLPVLTLAGPLALVSFALGLVDDAYGSGESRGFRGHLRALRSGKLTTGGLKLLGISAASYVAAAVLAQAAGWGGAGLLWALVTGAAVALTANFLNLMDLRPGRALKTYFVLASAGVISCVVGLGGVAAATGAQRMVEVIVLLAFVLGPVVAVWRYDIGERGMLGDAGANPAGAVAGLLIVSGLAWWAALGYLVVMLVLNVASERVSYSRLIEGNSLLRYLDGLGRPRAADNSVPVGTEK